MCYVLGHRFYIANLKYARRFDARFSQYGFSNHNAAESFAGLLIVAWETVNNQNASAHPAGIRQTRAKVNIVLAKGYVGKPDALKQYYSEYYIFLAMVYADAVEWQKSHNTNPAEFEAFQNIVYERFLKLGIDLKKLQLTDTGFKKI